MTQVRKCFHGTVFKPLLCELKHLAWSECYIAFYSIAGAWKDLWASFHTKKQQYFHRYDAESDLHVVRKEITFYMCFSSHQF